MVKQTQQQDIGSPVQVYGWQPGAGGQTKAGNDHQAALTRRSGHSQSAQDAGRDTAGWPQAVQEPWQSS